MEAAPAEEKEKIPRKRIINLLKEDKFEEAAEALIGLGQKKLGNTIASISHVAPYVSDVRISSLRKKAIQRVRNLSPAPKPVETSDGFQEPTGKKTATFKEFGEAMIHYLEQRLYSEQEISKQKKMIDEEVHKQEQERKDIQIELAANVFQPQIDFEAVPKEAKIAITQADVAIIGNIANIETALKGKLKLDRIGATSAVIRGARLLAINRRILFEGKPKRTALKNQMTLEEVSLFFSNKVSKMAICSSQGLDIYNHKYFLILPISVISQPCVRVAMGKIISPIKEWSILESIPARQPEKVSWGEALSTGKEIQ